MINNHLSPQLIEHKKKTATCIIWNPGPCLGQAQKCDRVKKEKKVNGIPPLPPPLDN
jgi:hypothetical protein